MLFFAAAVAALALALPLALAAPPLPVTPGERIDLKVLLISTDGSEPGYGAWRAALDREGVPYETFVAFAGQARTATLDDARLADYAAHRARFQAVILATGDLGHAVSNPDGSVSYLSALTDAEWAALAKFERTFGIRRLSDSTAPSPAHGLNVVGGATQDGVRATLTPAGRLAFPYLQGPVTIADDDPDAAETFGYHATPVGGAGWETLLAAPDGTALLDVYTHPDDGREELVMTVAGNQFQNHAELLRHGMLNWVTRGVHLGYERNYLELQVDDLFLGDDVWDPTTHSTSIAFAYAWQRCDARGADCASIANGSRHTLTQADTGHTLRVVVSAGNWISSVSQAVSAVSAVVPEPAGPQTPRRRDDASVNEPARPPERPVRGQARLTLTKLRMIPRRFAVSHRRAVRGTRLDGTLVSWRVSRAATVRFTFQRRVGRRWVRTGRITRSAPAGAGALRFRGRFGAKLPKPGAHRVVVRASAGRERTDDRRLRFRVVRG
jgi:hypothetical protein